MTPVPENSASVREAKASCRLRSAGFAILSRARYRGEIYEEDLDNAYIRDFLACHFHRKILRDALRPSTRRQGLRAANQIGKTRIGELIMKYLMKHFPANMIIYDPSEGMSNNHMKTRFMPEVVYPTKELSSQLVDIKELNRFNVTTQDIVFPGMVFWAKPLNESGTQQITVKYGMSSDTALVEPEFVRKMFIRSRQHEGEDYWFVESQGDAVEGNKGGGFKEFMATTNEMKLHVRCPHCQTRQRFLFHHARTADTLIVAPTIVPSLDRDAWVEHHRKILLGDDRKHAGFKVECELKLDDGSLDEQQIMRGTVYECPHCGGIARDDGNHGAMRRYFDREAGRDENWIATNLKALPGYLGYSLPVWVNPKISWGSVMLFFRQAMAAKKMGSLVNLQEFRTKWAGEDWDEKDEVTIIASVTATVNPLIAIPNELFRSMEVDCQKDKQLSAVKGEDMTGHFWVTAFATDKAGNDVQLWRGYCVTWDEWIAKYKALGIPTMNISIDISYKPDEVKAMAGRHAEIVDEVANGRKTGRKIYATWMMMRGSDQHSFRWDDGKQREFRYMKPEEVTVWERGARNPRVVNVPVVEWSNFRFKSILDLQRQRMSGMPTMTALPDNSELLSERTRLMEGMANENYSWDKQMNSEMPNKLPGKKAVYVPLHKENHYRDDCCMQKVRKLMAGVLGSREVIEQAAQIVE